MNSSIYISDKTWEEVQREWPESTATKAFKKLWEERKSIPQEVPQSIPHNKEGLEDIISQHVCSMLDDLQFATAEDVKEMIEEVMSQHLNDDHAN